jgi:hypothetical protein
MILRFSNDESGSPPTSVDVEGASFSGRELTSMVDRNSKSNVLIRLSRWSVVVTKGSLDYLRRWRSFIGIECTKVDLDIY